VASVALMAVRASSRLHRAGVSYRRILVPLAADGESGRAVTLAAELAADRGACITAVVVIEIPPELPLDAHMLEEERRAKALLEEARATGGAYGIRVAARTLRSREAGEAIVSAAGLGPAELVVLLAPRPQLTGRSSRVFGKTVDYVLKHAPCRVLVAAQPAHS
jgi:nucleotide-binding universal stress UspA family protein